MASNQIPDEIQQIQSAYRRRILECWNIQPGARVLEVGCGQGDMTAVLADAVGPNGHVVATDIATREYGSPQTLGEATDLIMQSELGERISFVFNCFVSDRQMGFWDFGYGVMAHCSWYFTNPLDLKYELAGLHYACKNLCFAEWDSVPHSMEQLPHYLAIQIQGRIEAFQRTDIGNVRCPFSVKQIKEAIEASGWTITSSSAPDTSDLQDADWEIAACLAHSLDTARALNLPPNHLMLIESEIDLLRKIAKPSGNRPLNAVALLAQRSESS